jgi:hypothetical protein
VGSAFLLTVFHDSGFQPFRLAGRTGILSVVLSGIIVGGMFSAFVGLMQYVADPDQKLPGIIAGFWAVYRADQEGRYHWSSTAGQGLCCSDALTHQPLSLGDTGSTSAWHTGE